MEIFKTVLDFHNSDIGFHAEAFAFAAVIYRMVAKKMGVFIREQFEGIKSALQIQSTVVDGHTKDIGALKAQSNEHDEKLKNHETRIGVLEKPKP